MVPLGKSALRPVPPDEEPEEELDEEPLLVETDSACTTWLAELEAVVVGAAAVETGVVLVLLVDTSMNWAATTELEEGVGIGVDEGDAVDEGVDVVEAGRTVEILSPTRTYFPAAMPA